MPNLVVSASASGTSNEATSSLRATLEAGLGGRPPALVMVFASTAQPLGEVTRGIQEAFAAARVLGASTAGEFTERGDAKGSVVAVAVAGDFVVEAGMATGLAASAEEAVGAAIASLSSSVEGHPYKTGVLLLDPLAGNGEEATLLTAGLLGGDVALAGGAAGDDLKMAHTEVALGARAATDAVVVALIHSKRPLGVGVCHGHAPVSDPVTVTRAEGATVYEVDGRPAWDVWAERTRDAAAKVGLDPDTLTEDQVGGFLLRYEAGLASGEAYKIRAPLSRGEDGSLGFACGIPEGATIRITESVPERQIDSARTAAERARAELDAAPAGAIVFDCICRNLILGDRFQDAVGEIASALGDVPLAGFETYGEIALVEGDLSGFHNTTTVVLAIPR